MGDRGNIVIQEKPGKRVYLYTHWTGSGITETAKKALKRKERWNDPAYLARIVFDTLTEDAVSKETGFGISTGLCDNEYPILVIGVDTQWVWYENEDGTVDTTIPRQTFSEFTQ